MKTLTVETDNGQTTYEMSDNARLFYNNGAIVCDDPTGESVVYSPGSYQCADLTNTKAV